MSTKQILPKSDRVYVCAHCGRKLEKANGTVFACVSHRFHNKSECEKVRFRKQVMEDVVFDALKGQLLSMKPIVRKTAPNKKAKHVDTKRVLDSLTFEMSAIERKKLELYEMYRLGDLTLEEYMKKKEEFVTEWDLLIKRLAETEEEYKNEITQDSQKRKEQQKAIIIAKTDDEVLRSHMYEAIEKVIVFAPNKIEISWKFEDLFSVLQK